MPISGMGDVHRQDLQVQAGQGLQAVADLHLKVVVGQVGQAVQGDQRAGGH